MKLRYASPFRFIKFIALCVALILQFGCASNDKKNALALPSTPSASSNHMAASEALKLQGHPYVPGGESPQEGFDCSGLVYYVYNKQGVKLPRNTWSLASQLPSVQIEQRQPGDLVFFNTSDHAFSHVGIYVGNDQFVHAPSSEPGRVMVSSLSQPYWRQRFNALRRPYHHHISSAANRRF